MSAQVEKMAEEPEQVAKAAEKAAEEPEKVRAVPETRSFVPNDELFREEQLQRHIPVPSIHDLPVSGMDARTLMTHPRSTRVPPEKLAELMLDEYMRNPPTEEERAEAAKRPSDKVPEVVPEAPPALFIKRRREYDALVKQSYKKQVILMISQEWSLYHETPWFDALANEADLPSVLAKADYDSATTEFLKETYETTCFPSFYVLKDGKLHVTVEHEERDVIEAWARAGDEPEGWPAKFGYTDDGDAIEDPDAPDPYENWPVVMTVGVDDAGVEFDHLGRRIPGKRRPRVSPLTDVFVQ